MRKYQLYTLVAEDGATNETFGDYREAFGRYQRTETPKTLYAHDVQGEMTVLFSNN